jgi:hypothetical protein
MRGVPERLTIAVARWPRLAVTPLSVMRTTVVFARPGIVLAIRAASRPILALLAAGAIAPRLPRGSRLVAVSNVARVERMIDVHSDLLADRPLDVSQESALLRIAEGDGDPIISSARGAANAMDIAFRLVRQIEVDDMGDAIDVDAARGDIGRDQDTDLAVAEVIERLLTGILRLVAVNGIGPYARLPKLIGDLVGAMLGAGEDQRPRDRLIAQEMF